MVGVFPAVPGFAILLAAIVAATPAASTAQDLKQQKKLPDAPAKLPKVPADKTRGLEFLFGALKAAPDEASAKHVEARIWAIWLQTPSDTVALLMTRAKAAMDGQNSDAALNLLAADAKFGPAYVQVCTLRPTL